MSVIDKYRVAQEKSVKIEKLEAIPYKAFETANSPQRRIDIRPRNKAQRILSYAYLGQILHAGGMIVGLEFTMPKITVQLEGKNLQNLITALREDKVTSITEFTAARFIKPADTEAIITKMTLTGPAVKPPLPPTKPH